MGRIIACILIPAILLLLAGTALAGPILTRADLRQGQDLSGPWNYSVDPYRDGVSGFHRGPPGVGHRRYDDSDVDAVTRADPKALYEYDMQRAPIASLPASWLTHAPEMRHYQGLVWYQRRFEAPALAPGQRAFLRFEAANYTAKAYLNGKLAGEHEGGFTPFAFEVTDLLRGGQNQVTVGVDSTPAVDGAPPPVTDWENYGGLTRPVRLVITPATYIDEAWVRLTPDGKSIAADVRLDGPEAAARAVTVTIAGQTLAGRTNAEGVARLSVPAPRTLKRWAPGAPVLHDVRIEAGQDVLRDRVGLRTVEVRNGEILVNGRAVFLRGICLHEEELGENPARTMTEASARALLSEAQTGLHANFVRLAHYPHAEVTTRLADEMGLLVWSEIPIYWLVDFANARTLGLARAMLEEAVRRDRNRASVILWSVANETPVGEARNRFLQTLVADVRALDDTRLVTAALLAARKTVDGRVQMSVDDPLADSLDVLAVNTYAGWYGGDSLEAVAAIGWAPTKKPLVFSEFGADALAGFHDPTLMRKFSETFQARYYVQTLAMTANAPSLRGLSPWILKDFRSPRRQHPVYQQGWNRKGLISPTGQRKAAFKVLADHYAKLAGQKP